MAAQKAEHVIVEVSGQELRVSNPGKLFFPQAGVTKLDLINYHIECEDAVVRHLRERPTVMKRCSAYPECGSGNVAGDT